MREILFRGKAINRCIGYHRTNYKNGDWIYGLLTRLYDERFEFVPATMTNTDGVSNIEIDYRTIGQYTGQNDKYKKKIFEGDIVFVRTRNIDEEDGAGVVSWDNEEAMYVIEFDGLEISFQNVYGYECEVIGNIHDNPELL